MITLHDWYCKTELTTDRAGLLCVQALDPCICAFMKLAGGASRLYAEMDRTAFLQQLCAYEDADELCLNKAYKDLLTLYRMHLFSILRAKELDAWPRDGYRHLRSPQGFLNA